MATAAYDISEITLIKRITAKAPKAFEMNFLGSGWCWFEDYQGYAYWLHVPTETLIESGGIKERDNQWQARLNGCKAARRGTRSARA